MADIDDRSKRTLTLEGHPAPVKSNDSNSTACSEHIRSLLTTDKDLAPLPTAGECEIVATHRLDRVHRDSPYTSVSGYLGELLEDRFRANPDAPVVG